MVGVELRSKKPSDKGRVNDLEKSFNYIRYESPWRTRISDNGMEPQHYIVGLSNNTNTLTFLHHFDHSYVCSA